MKRLNVVYLIFFGACVIQTAVDLLFYLEELLLFIVSGMIIKETKHSDGVLIWCFIVYVSGLP